MTIRFIIQTTSHVSADFIAAWIYTTYFSFFTSWVAPDIVYRLLVDTLRQTFCSFCGAAHVAWFSLRFLANSTNWHRSYRHPFVDSVLLG